MEHIDHILAMDLFDFSRTIDTTRLVFIGTSIESKFSIQMRNYFEANIC